MKLLRTWTIEKSTEYEATYEVTFDPSHYIYKAHFPDQPITPGVCIIQMVTELASELSKKRLSLECAKNVKFLSLLIPSRETPVQVELKLAHESNDAKHWYVKAVVKRGIITFAKLSLVYVC